MFIYITVRTNDPDCNQKRGTPYRVRGRGIEGAGLAYSLGLVGVRLGYDRSG
jgi:hypothetical protein